MKSESIGEGRFILPTEDSARENLMSFALFKVPTRENVMSGQFSDVMVKAVKALGMRSEAARERIDRKLDVQQDVLELGEGAH
jgi:hypothetical protein